MAAENVPFEEGPKWWEADDDSQDGQVEEQAIGLMDKPMYENRKSLKREVNRVKDILLNVAMKKTLVFWRRLIRDDQLLEALPLKALRVACDTRNVSRAGKRLDLIMAIEKSILDEEEALRQEEIERIAEAQKELEASGSVYVCGDNSNGQLGLGDYHSRDEFTVIMPLRGRGVKELWAPLDSDLVFARTEEEQVLAWGWGQGAPFFGLKAKPVRDEALLDMNSPKYSQRLGVGGIVEGGYTPGSPLLTTSAINEIGTASALDTLNQGLNNLNASEGSLSDGSGSGSESSEGDGIGGGQLQSLVSRAQAVQGMQAKQSYEIRFNEPTFLEIFDGEAVDTVALGRTHAIAKSVSGDAYVWGYNGYYQLGLSNPGDNDPLRIDT